MDWVTVAIQAGGAIGVCGMFLWYLGQKQKQDDIARKEFLSHLETKDASNQAYLRERDAAVLEGAKSGHAALDAIAKQVSDLRNVILQQQAGG